MNLFIRLTVNGEIKQNGNTSQFIFTPEEQIEYASNILIFETGDFFSCGTCGGVGQGTNTFLNAGDVMETEIEGLGRCATVSLRRRLKPGLSTAARFRRCRADDACRRTRYGKPRTGLLDQTM